MHQLLHWLALPQFGLGTVFVVSFISATLLPLGSEPAVFGPRACLLSWLPIVGDPLCAVAGWLRLPFWPCVAYMAVGKFLRYLVMTTALLYVWPGAVA